MRGNADLAEDADDFHILAHLKFGHGLASSVTRRSVGFIFLGVGREILSSSQSIKTYVSPFLCTRTKTKVG